MFLVNWFYDVLAQLGLYHKNAKLLFLGLDNAGKTTLLHVLKKGRVVSHVPTLHPNQDEMTMGQIRFKAYDLGGHEGARKLWKDYFATIDGVVFIVDASEQGRLSEAKKELDALLLSEELADVPFLILGNKIDMPTAVSDERLRYELGLQETTGQDATERREGERPIEVFMVSILYKMGYDAGFKWLSNFL